MTVTIVDGNNKIVSNNNRNADITCNYESTSYASKVTAGSDSDTSTDYYYDDRYVSVWQTASTFGTSANAISPSMDVDSSGNVYGAWSSDAAMYYKEALVNGTRASPFSLTTWKDSPDDNDMTIIGTKPFFVILDNWQGSGNEWSSQGLMIAIDGQSLNQGKIKTDLNKAAGNELGESYTIEVQGNYEASDPDSSDGLDEMMFQFKNPKITGYLSGSTYYMYVSYFDDYAKCLKYAYFSYYGTTPTAIMRTAWGNVINGKCVVDGYDTTVSGLDTYQANVGLYSDIVVDTVSETSNKVPVIAYCDSDAGTLKIARGKSASPYREGAVVTTSGSTPTVTNTNGWYYTTVTNPTGVSLGNYVSMAIDDGGNLHIATQDSESGDLYYIYATYSSAKDNGYTIVSCTKIDSANSVGKWTDIKLESSSGTTVNEVTTYGLECYPVISYIDATNIDSKKAIKAAYVTTASTATEGTWETITAPASYVGKEEKTSLVLSAKDGTSTSSKLGIGYKSASFATVFLRDEVNLDN